MVLCKRNKIVIITNIRTKETGESKIMRFVPTNCLRANMQLAKTIYGKNNELLLKCGVTLTQRYIDSIRRLKYSGVYIEDDISKDIEVVNVISDNLRIKIMNGIKKIFMKAEHGGSQLFKESVIKKQVGDIIDELLNHKGMMVNMIDLKCFDNYTYSHSVNVAVLSIILGIALGLKKDTLVKLGLGAIMHDIGKVFVDKDILNKPEKLTEEEFNEIKKHSKRGYEYVKEKFNLPTMSSCAILDHHEKYDGSGYPHGKNKDEISLFGKIIAVADVYDALSSERTYRQAMNPSESMEYIMSGSGTLFDPKIVDIFIRKIAPYPVGTMVQLSNNWVGIVVENYESLCLRPTVRVIQQDENSIEPFEISLRDDFKYLNLTISGVAYQ